MTFACVKFSLTKIITHFIIKVSQDQTVDGKRETKNTVFKAFASLFLVGEMIAMQILPYRGIWPRIAEDVFIAPGAIVIGDVTIMEGASIWYNVVVRGDSAPIVIGRRSNIQDNCTLHVDADAPLSIGDECTIGHNAVVHGATLGDQVLVGMSAVVLSHAEVGSQTIIGACALVGEHKSISGNVLAVGIPARIVRPLTEGELAHLVSSADGYYLRAQEHRVSLKDLSSPAE